MLLSTNEVIKLAKSPEQFHGMEVEGHEETTIDSKTAVENLKLLLESIKYQQGDLEFQEQALNTMASVFRTSDVASSFVVNCNGLEHVLRILVSSKDKPDSLREASLHALCAACENNGIAQEALCIKEIFCALKKFLLMKSATRLKTLSCYLLICLMTNNEKGQALARKTKCIETLRYLFKDVCSPSRSPRLPNRLTECLSSKCDENEALINLWQTATNALSVCVNSPRNNENQLLCLSAFPAALAYLRNCDSESIKVTTLIFLTNCLANNSRCQVSFRLVGGLRTVCDVLREELLASHQIPSSVLRSLVLTIEAAVAGNDMCRDSIAELEIVPVLLQSVQLCFESAKFKVQCLITLAACIEGCESNCKQFFASEGMSIVIKLLAESQNCQELQKSATCVLYTAVEQIKTAIPTCTDRQLPSDLLRDYLKFREHQENNQNLVQAEGEQTKRSTQKSIICCDDINNPVLENQSNISVEQSDMANRIEDLTKEVRCLKRLFDTKEENFPKSATSKLIKRVIDIVKTGCDTQGNGSKDEIENKSCTMNNTRAHTISGQISRSNTNSRKSADVDPSRNITDDKGVTESKEGKEIAMKETDKNANKFEGQKDNVSVDSTNTQSISEEKTTVIDNDISCESNILCSQNIHDTLCDRENTDSSSNKSKNSLASRTDLIVNVGKRCQTGDEIPRSIHDNVSNVNCEPPKFSLPNVVHSDSNLSDQVSKSLDEVSDSQACRSLEYTAEIPSLSSENVIEDVEIFLTSSGDVSNGRETQNICHAETPDKPKTIPRNIRGRKRLQLSTSKQAVKACVQPPKRKIQLSDSDDKDVSLSDSEERLLESSDEVTDITNKHLPVVLKTAVTSKDPILPLHRKQLQPLVFKDNKKISPKCPGCYCDFKKVNSRNFLSSLRSNMDTCSEHRVFTLNILTALKRYGRHQTSLKQKRISPDYDFPKSPKLNVRCENSLNEIIKKSKIKPKRKISRPRKMIPFSEDDVERLTQGVDKYGLRFNLIAKNIKFSTKRSAKTLKQKYQSVIKAAERRHKTRSPLLFTAQEVDNLKAGVFQYGHQWSIIMNRYKFRNGRTPQSLKDKWRNLLKTCDSE